ncbi:MAG: TfoX/Sxy family protein [Cytophagales bacterium]|nr:TfoX/Sxy family protein [Cytophagales bacterium]
MSYNEELASRLRNILQLHPGIEERLKMGGLSFMRNSKVLVRVEGDDLVVRCDPGQTEKLLSQPATQRYQMKGKMNMKGWLLIRAEGTKGSQMLEDWVNIALQYNRKLANLM